MATGRDRRKLELAYMADRLNARVTVLQRLTANWRGVHGENADIRLLDDWLNRRFGVALGRQSLTNEQLEQAVEDFKDGSRNR